MLRPGGHLRADSALRSLRDKGLPAEPITVVPRSGRGADGRVVWYSALMLDVARLIRVGDIVAAEAAHAAATRLAGHRAARFVADWLVENSGPDPDPAAVDLGTGGALTRLATLTASARARLLPSLRIDTFAGRVADVTGRVAVVVDEGGRSLPIPAPSGSPRVSAGGLVVVDIEELSGGATTLWVRSAFDPAADVNERVPGGPQLLTPAERDRLSRTAAASR